MNTHIIQRQRIAAIAEMIAPMCDGDNDLLQDMLEGETDLLTVVSRLHELRARDEETLAGIKQRKADLAEREKRIRTRADHMKAEIGSLLRLARLSKLELPEVTYSVRDGKPSLKVVDPDAVPDEYLTYKPQVNKTQINADFDSDGDLPNWLVREPATDVVTGRVK